MIHTFGKSKIYGDKGEYALGNYLRNNPDFCDIEKIVSAEEQKKGKDWKYKSAGTDYYIDVKTDSWWKTGNIAIETISDEARGVVGWLYKNECDFIYYYFPDSLDLYIIPMNSLREWCEENIAIYRIIPVPNRDPKTGRSWTAMCHLVPRSIIVKEVVGTTHIKLTEEDISSKE